MIKIIFNTILGLLLIVIWAHFVNLGQIIETISKVNPASLLPVFIFMFLSPFLRTIRLKVFLSEIKKVSLKDLIFLNGVSLILNFFIPVRAGEIAKGIYLNNKYNLPLAKSLTWIFIDRFVDFLAVLLLAGLLFGTITTKLPSTFFLSISFLFIIALLFTYLAVFQSNFSKNMVNFFKHILILGSVKKYFVSFSHLILDSFSVLNRHPKDLFLMAILTILAYGADGAIWYFTFIALGAPQDFLKMYLGQLLSALSYLIPAAPGYIGSAEASGLVILSGVFGIEANLASAMTVLFHITSAIFVIIFGLISIFNLKLDLGLIMKKALKRG